MKKCIINICFLPPQELEKALLQSRMCIWQTAENYPNEQKVLGCIRALVYSTQKKKIQEQLMQQLVQPKKGKPRTYDLAICVTSKKDSYGIQNVMRFKS